MGTHQLFGQVPEADIAGLVADLAGKSATGHTHSYIASAEKAAASGVASLDSGTKVPIAQVPTGTSSTTVAIGNDARLSDTRTPTDSSVTNAKVDAAAAIAESKLSLASDAAAGTASRRTLGTGSTQAAAGNHSHAAALVPWAPQTGTDGATITLDSSLGTFFRVSLAGDRTLAVPTNGTDGQRLLVEALASSAQRILTLNASILLIVGAATPITIPSGKRWFGGLLRSSSTWYLIASAIQA